MMPGMFEVLVNRHFTFLRLLLTGFGLSASLSISAANCQQLSSEPVPQQATESASRTKSENPSVDSAPDLLNADYSIANKTSGENLSSNEPQKQNKSSKESKHWWESLSLSVYTQVRYGAVTDPGEGAPPQLLGDRGIGDVDSFTLRRARLKISGDVAPHLGLYIQPDFAVAPPGGSDATATYFAQVRDWYGDVYVDPDKVHRFRIGQSKIPYGFENMQSSSNRAPMDRSDPINVSVAPNERDLGILYYWTPKDKQKLFSDLQTPRYKGSGNYGIFGVGIFNGQGGSLLDLNSVPHTVARVTWPWEIWQGQICEVSLQGLCGELVVVGDKIRPLGTGPETIPFGTFQNGGAGGIWEKRLGSTFVWYPMDFGFQSEWHVGEAPGLSDDQTRVTSRAFYGGYVMAMYAIQTDKHGTWIPYTRWSYGNNFELSSGIEWLAFKEFELTLEYTMVDRVNTMAMNQPGALSYDYFNGSVIRLQAQLNF
jgi:hypothetical protein